MKTRVITLWQPYASFVAWQIKEYETRGWQPRSLPVGATLLIHAAKRKPQKYEQRLLKSPLLADTWKQHGVETYDDLDYGVILCATRYMGAVSTNEFVPAGVERLLGNYQPDRFAWHLQFIKLADPPIMVQGQQRIWFYEW